MTRGKTLAAPFVATFHIWKRLEREAAILRSQTRFFSVQMWRSQQGGRVALSAGDDPTRIVRIAERGSLLGLPATVNGKRYSLTAEVVAQSRLAVLSPRQLAELLRNDSVLGLMVVQMLAEEVSAVRKLAMYKC